jgi:hypothetical protein
VKEQVVLLGLLGLAAGVLLLGLFQRVPTAGAETSQAGADPLFHLEPRFLLSDPAPMKKLS